MAAQTETKDRSDKKERSIPPRPDDALSYTIDEAAAHLRVSRSAIYALLAEGKLPRRKIGRRTLVLKSDIDAFFAAQAEVPYVTPPSVQKAVAARQEKRVQAGGC